MPLHVVDGAQLKCTLGTAPSNLKVVRPGMLIAGRREANITDSKPMTNIKPFGNCKCGSCKNQVACKPETSGPWVQVIPPVVGASDPSLLQPAILKCGHGGVISVVNPGQQKQTAKTPKKSDINVKAEVEQQLFKAETPQVKIEASLKGELSTNPAAQQSFNVTNAQASMSQQLNGATLNLNSAGIPEVTLANGQSLGVGPPSFAPASNGFGFQASFPLGEVGLANGSAMNASMVISATANPLNLGLGTVTIPSLTPAQLAAVGQATAGVAAAGVALGGDLIKNILLPMAAGGV